MVERRALRFHLFWGARLISWRWINITGITCLHSREKYVYEGHLNTAWNEDAVEIEFYRLKSQSGEADDTGRGMPERSQTMSCHYDFDLPIWLPL